MPMFKLWFHGHDNIFSTQYVDMYLFRFCSLSHSSERVQDLLPSASIVFRLQRFRLLRTQVQVFGPELVYAVNY